MESTTSTAEPRFRSSKRGKTYRKRSQSPKDNVGPSSPHERSDEHALWQVTVEDALRQRRHLQQKHRAGVEFSSSVHVSEAVTLRDGQLERHSPGLDAQAAADAVVTRFTPQTGHVKQDLDKHMMDFIEVELAKRNQQTAKIQPRAGQALSPINIVIPENANPAFSRSDDPEQARALQPATVGKLQEVDLGPDAKQRNEARTQAAINGEPLPNDTAIRPSRQRIRIGRDGMPYIQKPRPDQARRNSIDIARDQLVDQLLDENTLQIYDDGGGEINMALDTEGTSDDRIAEQFRQEFLDAVALRRDRAQKARAMASATAGAKGAATVDDRPKGPKLGGSRSARAAMREREAAAAAAAVKKR